MKRIVLVLMILAVLSCKQANKDIPKERLTNSKEIVGSWKLVYGEIKEEDSIQVKDLSKSNFIKLINKDHFAFFNQPTNGGDGFYAGGGSYSLDGNNYVEKLEYIAVDEVRGHEFQFQIEIKGDTLIQSGIEDVPEAGIKRHIIEKYVRIDQKSLEK